MAHLTVEDLAVEGTIFQIGIAPNRIDVLTSIQDVRFEDAWSRRVSATYGGIPIHVLSQGDLIRHERAVGGPQDLLDVERLDKARRRSN